MLKYLGGIGIRSGPLRQWMRTFNETHQITDTLATVVQFGCFVHIFAHNVMDLTQTVGPSMAPTLNPSGDIILHESITPLKQLQRGDVIIAVSPEDPTNRVCKRIVGLPGDVVRNDSKRIFGAQPETKVPRGHVWLQGDNRADSKDSRTYGPLPLACVKGRVVGKVYPFWEAGALPACDFSDVLVFKASEGPGSRRKS